MNVLVVGAGSIGARHAANLTELGAAVSLVEPDATRREAVAAASGAVAVYATLDEALAADGFRAALVCTPSNAHVAPALRLAAAGCHLFIEKPLALETDGLGALVSECMARGLITMVGCNMRFHPAVARVREIVSASDFGRVLWGDFEWGYYLPFARPADWRESYMANRALGGDLVFDDIHELDLACWFLGQPVSVQAAADRLAELTVDVEDCVDLNVRFADGGRAHLHADYLQHGYSRRLKVAGEQATVVWEFASQRIGVARAGSEAWVWEPAEYELRYNRMYLDEAAHFLDCVERGIATTNPLADAATVVQLALAARRSFETGTWETP